MILKRESKQWKRKRKRLEILKKKRNKKFKKELKKLEQDPLNLS